MTVWQVQFSFVYFLHLFPSRPGRNIVLPETDWAPPHPRKEAPSRKPALYFLYIRQTIAWASSPSQGLNLKISNNNALLSFHGQPKLLSKAPVTPYLTGGSGLPLDRGNVYLDWTVSFRMPTASTGHIGWGILRL